MIATALVSKVTEVRPSTTGAQEETPGEIVRPPYAYHTEQRLRLLQPVPLCTGTKLTASPAASSVFATKKTLNASVQEFKAPYVLALKYNLSF